MLSDQDLKQIQAYGIDKATVERQIENFRNGFPYLNIVKAATLNDGILPIDDSQAEAYIQTYEQEAPQYKVMKFVPASGAASRMFKDLFAFVESYRGTDEDYQKLVSEESNRPVFTFFKRIHDFAFHDELEQAYAARHKGLHEAILQREYVSVLKTLLEEDGLHYGSLPKGLLKFHRYETGARTPVEEHLVEGAHYARSADGKVYIHFTVSPEHRERFESLINAIRSEYEQRYQVSYDISYSVQKPSTDMIAVDMQNEPFRQEDGAILFRPGGHGALLENLHELDADLVFIKNIDNVVPDRLKDTTYRYKKLLGGVLLNFQARIFSYLRFLDEASELNHEQMENIRHFVENELCVISPQVFAALADDEKVAFLIEKLDRPVRVCGMVKNQGEPGGGPFWVSSQDGTTTLQIVESAQVDMDNPQQRELFEAATHFNPVDIVCSLKNYKGEKFDLPRYVDPQAGFITKKSKDGRTLQAQELPGLWNGSMADWNTIFVEVPIITFNPVKTVNDILREQHQEG